MDKLVGIALVVFGTVATTAVITILAKQVAFGDLAAWVQAVGSIAAIYWAGRIARQQFEESRKLQFEQQIHHLIGLEAFLSLHVQSLHKAEKDMEAASNPNDRFNAARQSVDAIANAIEVLHRIPFHEVPYAFVAVLGAGLIEQLEMGLTAVNKVVNGGVRDHEFGVAMERLHRSCAAATFYLSQIMDSTIYHDGKMVPITLG